jgi:hypothetical protein
VRGDLVTIQYRYGYNAANLWYAEAGSWGLIAYHAAEAAGGTYQSTQRAQGARDAGCARIPFGGGRR